MLSIHLNLEQQQARGQEQREDMQRAFPSIGVHKRKYENDAESSKKKLRLDRATLADPVAGQVEMARELTALSKNCNITGCSEEVSLANMTKHYTQHVELEEAKEKGMTPVTIFKCCQCGKTFRLRKARDHHEKTQHKNSPMIEPEMDKMNKQENIGLFMDADFRAESPEIMITSEVSSRRGSSATEPTSPRDMNTPERGEKSEAVANSLELAFPHMNGDAKETGTGHEGKYKTPLHSQTQLSGDTLSTKTQEPTEKPIFNSPIKAQRVKSGTQKGKSQCQMCPESFQEFSDLRNHYSREHYWARLQAQYGAWDTTCYFCLTEFSSSERLLLHAGNFHCARSLDTYLLEEGYAVTTVEWTTKLINSRCKLCEKDLKNSGSLKNHISVKHFSKQLNREFPCPMNKNKKCPKCNKVFKSSSDRIGHIGSFHDEVLKYAKGIISVGDDDANIIPVDGFERKGAERCTNTVLELPENTGKVQESLALLSLLSRTVIECRKCKQTFATRDLLKCHLALKHYHEKLSKSYPGTQCPVFRRGQDCNHISSTNENLLEHIALEHERILDCLLQKDNLTLPPNRAKSSKVSSPRSIPVVGGGNIPDNKSPDKTTNQSLLVSKTPAPTSNDITVKSEPEQKKCYLCEEDFSTCSEDSVLEHFCNHYQLDLDGKYVSQSEAANSEFNCPQCGKTILDKLDFLDHIGVEHRGVVEFIPETFRYTHNQEEKID